MARKAKIVSNTIHLIGGPADGDTITVNSLRGSRGLGQVPTFIAGVRRLEDGITEIYTVTPDRFVGRTGRLYLDYKDGHFNAFDTLEDKIL